MCGIVGHCSKDSGKCLSPPGKLLLKKAAVGIIPSWVIARQKETFQGGSGLAQAIAARIHNPTQYYHAELRRYFGYLPKN